MNNDRAPVALLLFLAACVLSTLIYWLAGGFR